ncbi:MAG: hypothetical protein ABSD03_17455 [Vulcanimicrobiaceae bacterium]
MTIESIVSLLQHNPIFGGGLALGLTGGAIAVLRHVPQQAFEVVKRRVIISVEVRSNDELFDWLTRWLDALPAMRSARKLTASVGTGMGSPAEGERDRIVYSPAPGEHLIRFGGRLIWLTRREHEQKGDRGFLPETITVKSLGRDPDALRALFEDVQRVGRRRDNGAVRVLMADGDRWARVAEKAPRPALERDPRRRRRAERAGRSPGLPR